MGPGTPLHDLALQPQKFFWGFGSFPLAESLSPRSTVLDPQLLGPSPCLTLLGLWLALSASSCLYCTPLVQALTLQSVAHLGLSLLGCGLRPFWLWPFPFSNLSLVQAVGPLCLIPLPWQGPLPCSLAPHGLLISATSSPTVQTGT